MQEEDILTPIEVYSANENLRSALLMRRIIGIRNDTKELYIPTVLCDVWEMGKDKNGKRYRRKFPLYHQKFLFLLLESLGDIKFALENFDLKDSFEFPNSKIYTPVSFNL